MLSESECAFSFNSSPSLIHSCGSQVGPKVSVLVRARASSISIVTSGASFGPTARVFWPGEYLGPKRANWVLKRGQGERQSAARCAFHCFIS